LLAYVMHFSIVLRFCSLRWGGRKVGQSWCENAWRVYPLSNPSCYVFDAEVWLFLFGS